MKIKKVVAANMQQAMLQIRQELGDNAIIINSTREPLKSIKHLFGRRNIEVTAAADDVPPNETELQLLGPPAPSPLPVEVTVRTRPVTVKDEHPEAIPKRVIPGRIVPARLPEPILMLAGEKENSWFKSILQQELDKEEADLDNSIIVKWKKILRQLEVDDPVTDILFSDFNLDIEQLNLPPGDIIKVYLREQIIDILKQAYVKENGARINTFIGPTGVGKTISLVKLATQSKVVENKQIAMIAIYNHRFGAMEKLNYYGNIIGSPVEVVMTPAELTRAVENHRDKDIIYIDTEGRPSMNRSQVLELHSFTSAIGEPQNLHLVLSTATKNRDLVRIANDFKPVGYNNIIMTKLDETDTYGAMLNLVCNTGVPVSYITNGQNVPDDIEHLSPKRLAEILLGSVVMDEDNQT